MSKIHIGIVGAGIGGLAAAVALQKAGVSTTLIEQATAFGESGAGITLGPNAWHALEAIEPSLVKSLTTRACFPQGLEIRDGSSNQRLRSGRVDDATQRFGAPYGTTHRSTLHAVLLEALGESTDVLTGQRVLGVDQQGHYAKLMLKDRALTFDGIVGADGVRSTVRAYLNPSAEKPSKSDYLTVRAILRRHILPTALATLNPAHRVLIWWAPGMHCVSYPISNDDINLVGFVKARDVEQALGLLKQGFAATVLPELLEQSALFTAWPLWLQSPTNVWHQGNVALLGDAAHASLPYLAQGAAMALEDAAILGSTMSAELTKNSPDISRAFLDYAAKRKPRAQKVQSRSAQMQRIDHASGILRLGRNTVLRTIQTLAPNASVLSPLAWIYRERIK